MMSLIWFLLFGLIIGLLARAVLPGRQSMSLILTTLLGIVGSVLGGVVGNLLGFGRADAGMLQPAGFIGSLIGAVVVLFAYTRYAARRAVP